MLRYGGRIAGELAFLLERFGTGLVRPQVVKGHRMLKRPAEVAGRSVLRTGADLPHIYAHSQSACRLCPTVQYAPINKVGRSHRKQEPYSCGYKIVFHAAAVVTSIM